MNPNNFGAATWEKFPSSSKIIFIAVSERFGGSWVNAFKTTWGRTDVRRQCGSVWERFRCSTWPTENAQLCTRVSSGFVLL